MRSRLFIFILTALCSISCAGDLTITPSTRYQTIEGIGAALAMYEGWIPSHPYKSEIYDTLFKWTGISLLRFGNWLQDTLGDISGDSSIAVELRKRNPYAKILVSSWTPPDYLKANNNSNGKISPNSLKKVNGKFVYDQFGHWWKSSIRRYNASGIKPDYITIQNEINWNTDYWSCLFNPTENDTIAAFAPALRAVHDSIATLSEHPQILAPEVLGTAYNGVENYAPTLDTSAFYGWAFHFYGSGDYNKPPSFISNSTASFSNLMKTIRYKPRFMTEYCNLGSSEAGLNTLANPDTAKDWLNLAWIMQETFTGLNLTGWVFWDMAWGNTGNMVAIFPGWDRNSWPSTSPHGFFVHRTLPALGQYSRFIRGGWIRIDAYAADTTLKVSAFLSPKGDSISVVIVNPGYSPVTFTPKIGGVSNAECNVWTTSPTQALEKSGTWASGQNLAVAARTVTTITGNLGSVSSIDESEKPWIYPGAQMTVKSDRIILRMIGQSMQGTIEILDLAGHLLQRHSTGFLPAGACEVPIGALPGGMCIVRLVSKTGILTQKFVQVAVPDRNTLIR
jgi:O-glycosyl hydrolase